MEQQNAAKKAPEAPAKPSNPRATKRVVVTVDATKAGDSIEAKEAAIRELQRQVREDKEEKARRYARNLKTIEDGAKAKLYPSFFPTLRLPQEKAAADAARLVNQRLLELRHKFTALMNGGRVKDALATLQRAVEVQNGNLVEPPKGPVFGKGQEGGQKEGQGEGR